MGGRGGGHWQLVSSHLLKQWAAVRTHWSLMREPPQKWLPLRCRLTCHGQSPAAALLPPTIRLFSGAVPQSERQRVKVVIGKRFDTFQTKTRGDKVKNSPADCASPPVVEKRMTSRVLAWLQLAANRTLATLALAFYL